MIDDIYLLGGAVGGGEKDKKGWEKAAKAVSGKIYNCYSENDNILKCLYKPANGFWSEPIGYKKIALKHPKIVNRNCKDYVNDHMKWKEHFGEILMSLRNAEAQLSQTPHPTENRA